MLTRVRRAVRMAVARTHVRATGCHMSRTGGLVGVDVGIHNLATLSDGRVFSPSDRLRLLWAKLNKTTARKERNALREAILREQAELARRIAHDVVSSATIFAVETLGLDFTGTSAWACQLQMMRRVLREIEREARRQGKPVVAVPRRFPSTRTCSRCGSVEEHIPLSERRFRCSRCGFMMDRDRNAALNIAAKAADMPEVVVSLARYKSRKKTAARRIVAAPHVAERLFDDATEQHMAALRQERIAAATGGSA